MSLKLQIVIAADGTAAITGLEAVGNKVGDVGTKTRQAGKELENGMAGIGTQLEHMKNYLLGFVVFDKLTEYAGKAIELADGWNILNGKIKLATGSTEQAAQVTNQLYNLAQQLRVPLAETATLYGRLVPALKEFGGGSAEAVRITDALALSLKISGATQAESASAMLQFSQAMSAGALRGEEFNSMADAAPRLLQAVAEGMGKTRGELKGLAEQGKLTTDVVYAALSKQLPQLEKEFGQLPMTVGDAWTKLGNASMKAIGEFDKGAGITNSLAQALNKLTDYLPIIISGIVHLTEISAAYFLLVQGGPLLLAGLKTAMIALSEAQALLSLATMENTKLWDVFTLNLSKSPSILQQCSTGLGALKVAGSLAMAFFAGWEIGSWMYDNFAWARDAGIMFVSAMLKGWESLKFGALVAWEGIKFGFLEVGDFIRDVWAAQIDFIAKGAEKIGATELAEKLRGWSDSLAQSSTTAEEFTSRLGELTDARDKELKTIDSTIMDMLEESDHRDKVTTATNKQAQATDKLKSIHRLSAEEQQRLTNATDKLKQSIAEQEDELKRVIVGQQKVTDSEKLEMQVKEFLTKQGKNLTEAERQYFLGKLQLIPQLEYQAAAHKKLTDEQEAYTKKLEEGLKALQDDLDKAIEERESMGRTEAQVKALQVARDRETLAMLQAKQEREGCSKELDHEIEIVEKRIAVGEKLVAQLEDNSAFKKQQDQIKENTEQWKQFADDIGKDFTDGFQRMLEDGKSNWDSFTDSIKNTFAKTVVQWIYNAFAKPIVLNLVANMSGGTAGIAGGAGGSSGIGGISSLVGMAKGAYNFLSGGALTSMGDGITSIGARLGSTSIQDFGAGMAGGDNPFAVSQVASNAGSIFGSLLSTAGGYFVGDSINNAISGGYKVNSGVSTVEKIGTAVASYIGGPIGGAIAGAIGGLVNRAFGMGDKKVKSYGITGAFSGNDFSGSNYSNWKQDGGWFRSDKKGTDYSALDSDTENALDSGFAALKSGLTSYAKSLGLTTTAVLGYSKQINLELTSDQTANQQKIADLFNGMGDEMARKLLPNVSTFAMAGETASTTLQRLASNFDVTNAAASLLGGNFEKVFGNLDLASASARQSLISLSGGLDAFGQKVSFYYDNFYTQTEKNARSFAELDAKFDQLGINIDLSTESFRQLMDSDSTVNNPQLMAALLDIAPLFTQVMQSMGDAAAGQKIGVGVDATGLSDRQLAEINSSAEAWWKTYQPQMQAQVDQAAKTTDAILNLTNVSATSAEAIRAAIADGNTKLVEIIKSIQSSTMNSEAQSRAIQSVIDQMGRSTASAVETAVSANERL